jgi:hypothetical protein
MLSKRSQQSSLVIRYEVVTEPKGVETGMYAVSFTGRITDSIPTPVQVVTVSKGGEYQSNSTGMRSRLVTYGLDEVGNRRQMVV